MNHRVNSDTSSVPSFSPLVRTISSIPTQSAASTSLLTSRNHKTKVTLNSDYVQVSSASSAGTNSTPSTIPATTTTQSNKLFPTILSSSASTTSTNLISATSLTGGIASSTIDSNPSSSNNLPNDINLPPKAVKATAYYFPTNKLERHSHQALATTAASNSSTSLSQGIVVSATPSQGSLLVTAGSIQKRPEKANSVSSKNLQFGRNHRPDKKNYQEYQGVSNASNLGCASTCTMADGCSNCTPRDSQNPAPQSTEQTYKNSMSLAGLDRSNSATSQSSVHREGGNATATISSCAVTSIPYLAPKSKLSQQNHQSTHHQLESFQRQQVLDHQLDTHSISTTNTQILNKKKKSQVVQTIRKLENATTDGNSNAKVLNSVKSGNNQNIGQLKTQLASNTTQLNKYEQFRKKLDSLLKSTTTICDTPASERVAQTDRPSSRKKQTASLHSKQNQNSMSSMMQQERTEPSDTENMNYYPKNQQQQQQQSNQMNACIGRLSLVSALCDGVDTRQEDESQQHRINNEREGSASSLKSCTSRQFFRLGLKRTKSGEKLHKFLAHPHSQSTQEATSSIATDESKLSHLYCPSIPQELDERSGDNIPTRATNSATNPHSSIPSKQFITKLRFKNAAVRNLSTGRDDSADSSRATATVGLITPNQMTRPASTLTNFMNNPPHKAAITPTAAVALPNDNQQNSLFGELVNSIVELPHVPVPPTYSQAGTVQSISKEIILPQVFPSDQPQTLQIKQKNQIIPLDSAETIDMRSLKQTFKKSTSTMVQFSNKFQQPNSLEQISEQNTQFLLNSSPRAKLARMDVATTSLENRTQQQQQQLNQQQQPLRFQLRPTRVSEKRIILPTTTNLSTTPIKLNAIAKNLPTEEANTSRSESGSRVRSTQEFIRQYNFSQSQQQMNLQAFHLRSSLPVVETLSSIPQGADPAAVGVANMYPSSSGSGNTSSSGNASHQSGSGFTTALTPRDNHKTTLSKIKQIQIGSNFIPQQQQQLPSSQENYKISDFLQQNPRLQANKIVEEAIAATSPSLTSSTPHLNFADIPRIGIVPTTKLVTEGHSKQILIDSINNVSNIIKINKKSQSKKETQTKDIEENPEIKSETLVAAAAAAVPPNTQSDDESGIIVLRDDGFSLSFFSDQNASELHDIECIPSLGSAGLQNFNLNDTAQIIPPSHKKLFKKKEIILPITPKLNKMNSSPSHTTSQQTLPVLQKSVKSQIDLPYGFMPAGNILYQAGSSSLRQSSQQAIIRKSQGGTNSTHNFQKEIYPQSNKQQHYMPISTSSPTNQDRMGNGISNTSDGSNTTRRSHFSHFNHSNNNNVHGIVTAAAAAAGTTPTSAATAIATGSCGNGFESAYLMNLENMVRGSITQFDQPLPIGSGSVAGITNFEQDGIGENTRRQLDQPLKIIPSQQKFTQNANGQVKISPRIRKSPDEIYSNNGGQTSRSNSTINRINSNHDDDADTPSGKLNWVLRSVQTPATNTTATPAGAAVAYPSSSSTSASSAPLAGGDFEFAQGRPLTRTSVKSPTMLQMAQIRTSIQQQQQQQQEQNSIKINSLGIAQSFQQNMLLYCGSSSTQAQSSQQWSLQQQQSQQQQYPSQQTQQMSTQQLSTNENFKREIRLLEKNPNFPVDFFAPQQQMNTKKLSSQQYLHQQFNVTTLAPNSARPAFNHLNKNNL